MAGEPVVVVELRRVEVLTWWQPLVAWARCVPHLLATGATSAASVVVAVLAAVIAVVTGRVPGWVVAFQAMTVRERVRCFGVFFALRPDVPSIELRPSAADPGSDDRVTVAVPAGGRRTSRREALVRLAVLVPHLAALLPIGLVMYGCYPVWMALVAVNRGWPPAMAQLLGAVERWVAHLALYATFAVDERPAFGLAAHGYRAGASPPRSLPAG
jgi:hypothetical protein